MVATQFENCYCKQKPTRERLSCSLTYVCKNARSYVLRNSHPHCDLQTKLQQFNPCVGGLRLKDTRIEGTAINLHLFLCV